MLLGVGPDAHVASLFPEQGGIREKELTAQDLPKEKTIQAAWERACRAVHEWAMLATAKEARQADLEQVVVEQHQRILYLKRTASRAAIIKIREKLGDRFTKLPVPYVKILSRVRIVPEPSKPPTSTSTSPPQPSE